MMHKKLLTIMVATLVASAAFSQPRTFLGPTAHLGIVKSMSDDSAFALAGEAGPKNLRASGTIGWEFDYNQRMKATAEYLTQKLTFAFNDGQQNEWVQQSAVGLNYQYDFRQVDPFNTLLDFTAYYAHSPSKYVGNDNGLEKNIAGANAYGVGPGISLVSLYGTTAGAELNYDHVRYNNKYSSNLTVQGIGGTVRLGQALTDDLSVNGFASVRQPYNNYGGNITYGNLEYYGIWALSAFGNYTIGKNSMPSSYNLGLGADYFFDSACKAEPPVVQHQSMPKQYKDYKDFKDLPPLVWVDPNPVDRDFLNWVGIPAVHTEPFVRVDQICTVPTFTGEIDDFEGQVYTVDLSQYFNPGALVFNVRQNGIPLDPADYDIIGSTLYIYPNNNYTNIIVTGTNACGSASSNEFSYTVD